MPNPKDIPHLLKLVSDESDFVRDSTLRELRAFGTALRSELEKLPEALPADQIESVIRQVQAFDRAEKQPKKGTSKEPLFKIGQLVKHRRYGYRGIVVALDLTCQANDDWYHANRTQPDRNQPWYHVLVSGSDQGTYPAQSSLTADDSHKEVNNPLVPYFFKDLGGGHYIRNEQPWPSQE